MTTNSQTQESLRIWDLQIRVFHWSLMVFFLLAYWLEGNRLQLHVHAGYTIALLILVRLIWGVIGTKYARFANFLVSPFVSLRYFWNLLKGRVDRQLGHNPAGAAMIIALLLVLSITVFSGMVLYALEGRGPLANTPLASWPGGAVANIHELAADSAMILIGLHVLGVIYSSWIYKENLAWSMVTGIKTNRVEIPDDE